MKKKNSDVLTLKQIIYGGILFIFVFINIGAIFTGASRANYKDGGCEDLAIGDLLVPGHQIGCFLGETRFTKKEKSCEN